MSSSQLLASLPTAWEVYEHTGGIWLSTGCPELDRGLGGGIPFCPITEICGEAGVGKSQLLLKLALTAQLPVGQGGLGGSSVIISTEGRVPVQRLKDYLHSCPSLQQLKTANNSSSDGGGGDDGDDDEEILRRVLLDDQISDSDSLWVALRERLPAALENNRAIRLVIIDSITSVFRGEFLDRSHKTMMERNDWFFGLSGYMKQMHDAFGCMFVLANQVTTDLAVGKTKPALGLVWSHCVNQRFMLEFAQQEHGEETGQQQQRRRSLGVEFSPNLPCGLVTDRLVVGSFGLRVDKLRVI
ncbi:hypothetical protein BASA81_012520 [Batrachochytrium salamandrivorans]|nr:hypothetical protein BASA81_012520 [Batrachochytrium salamandrivorans]